MVSRYEHKSLDIEDEADFKEFTTTGFMYLYLNQYTKAMEYATKSFQKNENSRDTVLLQGWCDYFSKIPTLSFQSKHESSLKSIWNEGKDEGVYYPLI